MASTSLVAAGTALAQETRPPTAAESEMEEVVVRGIARAYRAEEQTTATGLEMKLIDTPQAISVLTPEMMEIAGANSIYEATDLVQASNGVARVTDSIAS